MQRECGHLAVPRFLSNVAVQGASQVLRERKRPVLFYLAPAAAAFLLQKPRAPYVCFWWLSL